MTRLQQIEKLIDQELVMIAYLRANLETLEPDYRSQLISAVIRTGEQWIALERLDLA